MPHSTPQHHPDLIQELSYSDTKTQSQFKELAATVGENTALDTLAKCIGDTGSLSAGLRCATLTQHP